MPAIEYDESSLVLSSGTISLILLVLNWCLPIFFTSGRLSRCLTFKLSVPGGGYMLPSGLFDLLLFLTEYLALIQILPSAVELTLYPETNLRRIWKYCPPIHLFLFIYSLIYSLVNNPITPLNLFLTQASIDQYPPLHQCFLWNVYLYRIIRLLFLILYGLPTLSDRNAFLISPASGLVSRYYTLAVAHLVMASSRKQIISLYSL